MKNTIILILGIFFLSCNFRTNNISQVKKAETVASFCDTSKFKVLNYFSKEKITRFQAEINKFAKMDSLNPPDKNSIIFVGSSSFRKWKSLKEDFSPIPVLNRGFGGSTFPELIYYSNQLIFKYNPKNIVIYEGDNDQYFISPEAILTNVCYLEKLVHSKLPNSNLFFVSIKPSPSRIDKLDKMIKTNNYIKDFVNNTKRTYYINVWDTMFNEKGKINGNIFQADSLHLNPKGYKIWTGIIKSKILKYYKN